MKIASLRDTKGELVAEINLPESMAEVSLRQYVEFLKAIEIPEDQQETANRVIPIAKAVSAFYDLPLEYVLEARFGKGKEAEIIEAVAPLYHYTHKLISEYQPTAQKSGDWNFKYKGIDFVMKGKTVNGYEDLTVLEAFECLEAQRLFRQQAASESGDPEGSYEFSHYLKIISTLCRKPGENLPVNDIEREGFLMERMRFFANIDAKTALDIDFFLASTLPTSEVSRRTVGFLTLRSLEVVAETRLRKQKPTRKRSTTRGKYSGGRATGG